MAEGFLTVTTHMAYGAVLSSFVRRLVAIWKAPTKLAEMGEVLNKAHTAMIVIGQDASSTQQMLTSVPQTMAEYMFKMSEEMNQMYRRLDKQDDVIQRLRDVHAKNPPQETAAG